MKDTIEWLISLNHLQDEITERIADLHEGYYHASQWRDLLASHGMDVTSYDETIAALTEAIESETQKLNGQGCLQTMQHDARPEDSGSH